MPSQNECRAIVLGKVQHTVAPSAAPAPRAPRLASESALNFARRVRAHGLDVETLPVSTVETMTAACAQVVAARAGVVVYRCIHLGEDTRDSAQVAAGVPFEAVAERTTGALAALLAELVGAAQAGAVRIAAKVVEGLARVCLERPGTLAAIEAFDNAALGRLLPGVTLYRGGGHRRVFVSPGAAKALGIRSGRCSAIDLCRPVGALNGIGGVQ